MRRLLPLFSLGGVPVTIHWSVALITGLLMLGALENAWGTLFLIAAYLGVMLLHEAGHMMAARWRRCGVRSIELYPIHGLTRIDMPRSRYDACLIAWGGVLAQLAVAAPIIVLTGVLGFTSNGPVNALLAVFGYFSAVIAVLNLFPVGRFDGATAWGLFPEAWARIRRGWDGRRARARRRARIETEPGEKVHKGPWVH